MKNEHIEHFEELMFDTKSIRSVLKIAKTIEKAIDKDRCLQSGLTMKFDGSPSLFAGVDPADGKFFVAKKSIFNKVPKVYKTIRGMREDLSNDKLYHIFATAFVSLRHLKLKEGVIQGDLMFVDHSGVESARLTWNEEKDVYKFTPNVVEYTIPFESEAGQEIYNGAAIGIVWHTYYQGDLLTNIKVVPNTDISQLIEKTSCVWSVVASKYPVIGQAIPFSTKTFMKFQRGQIWLDSCFLKHDIFEILSQHNITSFIKQFNNNVIKQDIAWPSVDNYIAELIDFIRNKYHKKISDVKMEATKSKYENEFHNIYNIISKNHKDIRLLYEIMRGFMFMKHIFLSYLNINDTIGKAEGYVYNDNTATMKLVDRRVFSKLNFIVNRRQS